MFKNQRQRRGWKKARAVFFSILVCILFLCACGTRDNIQGTTVIGPDSESYTETTTGHGQDTEVTPAKDFR